MATAKRKKLVMPKTLAGVADLYKQTRDERLAIEKDAKAIAEDEAALKKYLIENLPKSKAGGIIGKIAHVEIVTKPVPAFDENGGRDKFFAYCKRTKQDDLLTQSLNAAAIKQRWDAGKTVPGVIKFNVTTLSLHAVKAKA